MEADQRIELRLRGRRIANRGGDLGGVAGEILGKARVALGLRPHRVRPDPAAVDMIAARRAPADGPRRSAGAGIGIGLDQPVSPQPRTAFEPLDERDPRLTDAPLGRCCRRQRSELAHECQQRRNDEGNARTFSAHQPR